MKRKKKGCGIEYIPWVWCKRWRWDEEVAGEQQQRGGGGGGGGGGDGCGCQVYFVDQFLAVQ